uniref:Uncharacterized protein n=1 Tax=mine drainage metagenome TaxID=410659 RepID=E6PSN7_9ZZZZ
MQPIQTTKPVITLALTLALAAAAFGGYYLGRTQGPRSRPELVGLRADAQASNKVALAYFLRAHKNYVSASFRPTQKVIQNLLDAYSNERQAFGNLLDQSSEIQAQAAPRQLWPIF